MVSQTFPVNSAGWIASYPKGGGAATPLQFNNAISTIAYDAASDSYNLKVDGAVQVFGPANLMPAKSTAQFSVYELPGPNGTTTLTLTKPGTSGSLTYRFVGGALLQRLIDTGSGFDGRLSAATYGIKTPDSAFVGGGGGSARYSIDVLGAYLGDSAQNGAISLSGVGQMIVNFNDGTLSILAPINGKTSGAVNFAAEGRLSTASNGFTGNVEVLLPGALHYVGSLNGSFFGLSANEVGAHWGIFQPASTGGIADFAAGLIVGRRTSLLTSASSFTALANPQTYVATGSHFVQPFGTGAAAAQLSQGDVSVHYDPANNSYAVILPISLLSATSQISMTFPGNYTLVAPGNNNISSTNGLTVYTGANGVALTYTRAAHWLHQMPSRYVGHSFVFGYETPAASVPRSGQGNYAVGLSGQLVLPNANLFALYGMAGSGTIAADFGAGSLTLNGTLQARQSILGQAGPLFANGVWSGTGLIAANANSLSGDLIFDFGAVGQLNGPFAGRFFGPVADEIGINFSATGAAGSLSGTAIGKRN